ncbi:acyl carrier protein [Streptomyces sp. PSAA01]|uniref:acyl carrier protein n=1 Tax=Streptomyces sp. PSAA01 TaxID=2912762 RepID=UPI001F47D95A|nr:acyl carrier protein [Streptomyces sp. PSAA01]MCG0286183.1 acyl carrier protein [Streptomyces sp. PSAA01]
MATDTASPGLVQAFIENWLVAEELAELPLDLTVSLVEMGLDSLHTVELLRVMQREFNIQLKASELDPYTELSGIIEHVERRMSR